MVEIRHRTRFEEQFPRTTAYLKGLIHFHQPTDVIFQRAIREFTKWFFDLMRNAIIAGGLAYMARKSGSIMLKVAAGCAYGVLLFYCLSYMQTWQLRPFHPMKNSRVAKWLNRAVGILLIFPLLVMITMAVDFGISMLAEGQNR